MSDVTQRETLLKMSNAAETLVDKMRSEVRGAGIAPPDGNGSAAIRASVTSAAQKDDVDAARDSDVEPGVRADQRLLDRGWLRIGAGCLIAGQAMVFSFAVNLSEMEGAAYWVVSGVLMASALGALVFLGRDLVHSAWEAARARRVSVDLLFLVTLCGALGGSLVSTFARTGAVYYEVVAILIVVHTAGKMLGARSRAAALRAVSGTRERFDVCEVVIEKSTAGQTAGTRQVRVGELRAGDVVRVGPGGAIAVDGVILRGRGFVQETSMTGEWQPVSRGPGGRVQAGTFSVDGLFEIAPDIWEGTGGAGKRRLDGILSAVERARLAPSRLQEQADRLMAWFLPLVLCVSAGTFVWWFLADGAGGWARALFNAMAVLLVACPCAMGLATPAAVWGGLARLAGFGLVARTGDFLDALARVDFVCLDKTGTLSELEMVAGEWRVEEVFRGREAWLRACVAALEEDLTHPVAVALRASARARADMSADMLAHAHVSVDVSERSVLPGRGVSGVVDGARVAVGDGSLGFGAGSLERDNRSLEFGAQGAEPGRARSVFVFVNGALAATVALGEKWRVGVKEAARELHELGVGVEVLTGDPEGGRAGLPLPVRAGMSAEEKAVRVDELVRAGRCVLFVGDGINDAAAMSGAQASIAMSGGADLARSSAMAVFAGGSLEFLPMAIRVARGVRKNVFWNLRFATCYNVAGMALAACGWLHPVVAALLMVGSSVVVSASAVQASHRK